MGTAFSSVWNWVLNWRSSSSSVDTTNSAKTPEGVEQINSSVYKMYSPENGQPPLVDVVFFHGLQLTDYRDAYWKTWSSDDGKTIWPQDFLSVDFPRCRVLSVSYDSCVKQTGTTGRVDLNLIGENLVTDILNAEVGGFRSGKDRPDENRPVEHRPVILVGHCMGGFVIKKFLRMTDKKRHAVSGSDKIPYDEFLDKNLAGIFYYATPHGGVKADVLPALLRDMKGSGPLVKFLRVLGKEAARLNSEFSIWRKERSIPVFSIAESHSTSAWASLSPLLIMQCMHFTVRIYTFLLSCLRCWIFQKSERWAIRSGYKSGNSRRRFS